MHPTFRTTAALAAIALIAATGHAAPAYLAQTDRLIVKYKDAAPAGKGGARVVAVNALRQGILERAGQQLGARLTLLRMAGTGAHVFQLSRTVSLAEAGALAKDLMARDASVEYAEPDRLMTALSTPNDPRYADQ